MKPIIEVKGVGKRYSISHYRGKYVALRDVLMNIVKSPFKFFKQKAKNVAGIGTKEEFWALKGIDFQVMPGEVIGIIGRNGAGKSTLLKILTGITPPSEGEIVMRGRVASLLEVGTGFHPELTGRENIFLNGAILGMKKKEIAKNFESIVEFAGIEKFIDTPVKYYSSGMYVRLAFSVAAHMEPDILLVDEVLAVGDAEFQKKCLGKMEEVTQAQGRTILFVSHNLSAVRSLCKTCILLEKGKIKMIGETEKVIDRYLQEASLLSVTEFEPKDQDAFVTKVTIKDEDGELTPRIPVSKDFTVQVDYTIKREIERSILSLYIHADGELLLVTSDSDKKGEAFDREPGTYSTTVKIPKFLFNVGIHTFDVHLHDPGIRSFDTKKDVNFEILDVDNPRSKVYRGYNPGKISNILDHHTEKLS
ncbi:MAG TPA: ABC transporter ATP-binding protein [Candidatus Paceibacterota bacterium]|nr:ABC transporter ATP-binding protein [Candidatus Paceibacterota bacterium]